MTLLEPIRLGPSMVIGGTHVLMGKGVARVTLSLMGWTTNIVLVLVAKCTIAILVHRLIPRETHGWGTWEHLQWVIWVLGLPLLHSHNLIRIDIPVSDDIAAVVCHVPAKRRGVLGVIEYRITVAAGYHAIGR